MLVRIEKCKLLVYALNIAQAHAAAWNDVGWAAQTEGHCRKEGNKVNEAAKNVIFAGLIAGSKRERGFTKDLNETE